MKFPWSETGFWKWLVGLFAKPETTPTPDPTPTPTPDPLEVTTLISVVKQEREPTKGLLWVTIEKLPWAIGRSAFFWPDGVTKICDGNEGLTTNAMIIGTSTKLAAMPNQYILRVWPRFEWADGKHYLPAEILLEKPK